MPSDLALPLFEAYSENSEYASNKVKISSNILVRILEGILITIEYGLLIYYIKGAIPFPLSIFLGGYSFNFPYLGRAKAEVYRSGSLQKQDDLPVF